MAVDCTQSTVFGCRFDPFWKLWNRYLIVPGLVFLFIVNCSSHPHYEGLATSSTDPFGGKLDKGDLESEGEKISLAREDCYKPCPPQPPSNSGTEDEPSKICGSNQKWYDSACQLEKDACANPGETIVKAPFIWCIGKTTKYGTGAGTQNDDSCSGKFCPLNYKPVCDYYGNRYSNYCFFKIAQCKRPWLFLVPSCPEEPTSTTNVKPQEDGSSTGLNAGGILINCQSCVIYPPHI